MTWESTILMLLVAGREEVSTVLVPRGVVVRASSLQAFHTRRCFPRTHGSWPSFWASRAGTAFDSVPIRIHRGYFKSRIILDWADRSGDHIKE